MKTASPFVDVDPAGETVSVTFDGTSYDVPKGANLAAALLTAGVRSLRETTVSGAPRAPFCMMGACYDCLVEIDGVTVQACMTQARDGLTVGRAPSMTGDGDD